MNEVNIKYRFHNFQNFDFLDEFGLFIEEKPICTRKKCPSLCRRAQKVWLHSSTFLVKLRDFSPISPIDPIDFWTSGSNSVGKPPYEFLAPFLLLREISTNLILKHNKIKFQPKFRVRNLLSPAGLKKTNFQKLKKKQKKKLGFQRIEPMTNCYRAQAATVALISHKYNCFVTNIIISLVGST
jgi:hypothetical protein